MTTFEKNSKSYLVEQFNNATAEFEAEKVKSLKLQKEIFDQEFKNKTEMRKVLLENQELRK